MNLDFWSYDNTSKRPHVGRTDREFGTPGEARAYERGWYDAKCHAVMLEPYAAYRTGYYDAKAEHSNEVAA